jgi:ArsR family transcriptional regulator, lead/cadmium/zinc/bismuth-responsive transcriptional repressor
MDNKNHIEDSCSTFIVHDENVKRAREDLLSGITSLNMSDFFKILGDNTRIMILSALSNTELCVCDICRLLNMQQSAVSHQLKLLRMSRLIKSRKDGRMVYYSLADHHVEDIFRFALEHVSEPMYPGAEQ